MSVHASPRRPRAFALLAAVLACAAAAACSESPTGPRPGDARRAAADEVGPRRTPRFDAPADSITGGPVCETTVPESLLVTTFARGLLLAPPEVAALRDLRALRESLHLRAKARGLAIDDLRAVTSDAELFARLAYTTAESDAMLVKYAAARTTLALRASQPGSRGGFPGAERVDAPRAAADGEAGGECDPRALFACSVNCAKGPFYMFIFCEMRCIWDTCDRYVWWW